MVHHHGGACILPYFADGTICMVRQFRYAMQQQLWELPAGKLEKGEDPFAAAKRELEEECGLTADNYISLGEFYPTVGYDTEVIYTWVATGLHETKMHLDADEFLTPRPGAAGKGVSDGHERRDQGRQDHCGHPEAEGSAGRGQAVILYEDAALVVLDKPAGLSSEEGVPAALRAHWNAPDAFVGVVHRLDTGVSGLMVYARTPAAAAALSRQVTQSQDAYAVQDGRAEGKAAAPQFVKQYRAVISGAPDAQLPAAGGAAGLPVQGQPQGQGVPGQPSPQGVREAVLEYRILATAGGEQPCRDHPAHRAHPSDPGAVCQPQAPAVRRRQIWQPPEGAASPCKAAACALCTRTPASPWPFLCPLPAAAPWKEFLELGE